MILPVEIWVRKTLGKNTFEKKKKAKKENVKNTQQEFEASCFLKSFVDIN